MLLCIYRWAKLRMAMLPTIIFFEPLSECMLIGALAAWAVSVLFKWDSLCFYLIHILLWFMCDWLLLSIVQVSVSPSKLTFTQIISMFFSCRMEHCHLINSILLLAGCSASARGRASSCTRSLIRRFAGGRVNSDSRGAASPKR